MTKNHSNTVNVWVIYQLSETEFIKTMALLCD